MKNKFLLDTNFISSLLIEDDVNHSKALKMYQNILSSTLCISIMTIIELKNVKSYIKDGFMDAVNLFIDKNIDNIIPVDNAFLEFENYVEVDTNLKTVDKCIAISALIEDAELLTFDIKLVKEFKRIKALI